jgi:hypothetical protein
MTPERFGQSLDMAQALDGPIFVTADEPLLIFESIERALAHVEAQDVKDGIYLAFDRAGRRIDFTTSGFDVGYVPDEGALNPAEFENTLRRILDRWLPNSVPPSATLADLEALAIERFGLIK